MTDNTLTFETGRTLGLQEDQVIETVNSGAFPSGFTNSAQDVMVVIDTTHTINIDKIIQCIDAIKKSIIQSVNLDGGGN